MIADQAAARAAIGEALIAAYERDVGEPLSLELRQLLDELTVAPASAPTPAPVPRRRLRLTFA